MKISGPPALLATGNRRWQILYALAVLGLFGYVSLGCLGVGQRIGDGTGFYVMLFAWAENGTPYSNDRVGEKFVEYVKPRPQWQGQQHYYSQGNPMRRGGTADESHFWFYSLMAAPFYWPLKALGADVGLSFNCLHVVLLYIAVVLVHRRLGPAAAWSLVLLVVGSPAIWYANKAHTEFFTVVLGSLAAAYLAAGSYSPAAFCFAVVATQNPAFGLVVLLVLVLRLCRRGWKAFFGEWKWLLAVAAVLALHPVYYAFRAGAASPMLIGPELLFRSYFLPLRHMASFWIDPDVGLLATWPLGLPLLIAGAAMLILRRTPRRVEYLTFCALSSLMLTWTYARLSTGFGGGGTVDISRYSVWLLFLFFPVVWQALLAIGRQPRLLQRSLAAAGLALVGLTAWLYRPELDERCRRPTPGSDWLYANFSHGYDPLPRIFYDSRGGRRDLFGEDVFRWSDWAVSDTSGNKVFVWREAFDRQPPDAPRPVVGRGCLDPKAVYRAAAERFSQQPSAEYCYLNHRGREFFGPPTLKVGETQPFTPQADPGRFLAAGWFHPEQAGTWSNGPSAEIIFHPAGVQDEANYAILLKIEQVTGRGSPPLTVAPLLNGKPLAPVELSGPALLRWPVAGDRLASPTRLVLMISHPRSPCSLRQGSDTRSLGVMIASLRIEPLSPAPAAVLRQNAEQEREPSTQPEPDRRAERAVEAASQETGNQARDH